MSNTAESIIAAIEAYAEPLLGDLGLELVEIQYRQESHGWVLRFFIDKEDGVTIDACATVSRAMSTWLEVEDLIEQAYHLEVSSPGLERPLKKAEDFKRFTGRKVRVKVKEPRDDRRVFTGILESVQGNEIAIIVDGNPVRITFDEIARARLAL